MSEQLEPHLGGSIPGGDPATFYPKLWDYFVRDLGVRTVLDIGAGHDHIAVDYFASSGVDLAVGVDGDLDVVAAREAGVRTSAARDAAGGTVVGLCKHDYTTGPLMWVSWAGVRSFDLVWSCEFVEHVEERYLPHILESFRRGRVVAMTHAFPEQPGHHHVNCRTPEYWVGALAAIGYELDAPLTHAARARAAENADPWNHFVRSGLVFRRRG